MPWNNKRRSAIILSFIIQYTSTNDAHVCVRNYNSDTNNKDVITVDYVITGGRQGSSICVQKKKSMSRIENETFIDKQIQMELKLHKE